MAEGSKRTHQSNGARRDSARPTAVVYCEGNFGDLDGKTANGLVRHSERFEIVSVIDSRFAGRDAGELLGDGHNGIPVVADLADAVARNGATPDVMVFGIAPASGMLSDEERTVLLGAMEQGMGIVNGLHDFLNDDIEFAAASAAYGVSIEDVRRPPAKRDLRMFRNLIDDVACVRLARRDVAHDRELAAADRRDGNDRGAERDQGLCLFDRLFVGFQDFAKAISRARVLFEFEIGPADTHFGVKHLRMTGILFGDAGIELQRLGKLSEPI